VCDADGTCDLEDVKEGEVSRDDLTSDVSVELFVLLFNSHPAEIESHEALPPI
jgi:hypothetical protein